MTRHCADNCLGSRFYNVWGIVRYTIVNQMQKLLTDTSPVYGDLPQIARIPSGPALALGGRYPWASGAAAKGTSGSNVGATEAEGS